MNPSGGLSLREVVDTHYAALLDALAGHLDSQVRAAREQMDGELSARISAEVTRATAEVSRAATETWKAEQDRLMASHRAALERKEAEYREALDRVSREVRQELAGVSDERLKALEKTSEDRRQALAQAEAEHRQALAGKEQEHAQAVAALKEDHGQVVAALEAAHRQALSALRADNGQALEKASADAALQRAKAVAEARTSTAEALNQAARRIRQTFDEESALTMLVESSAPWASRAVVLQVENNHARPLAARGIDAGDASFPLASAAAISGVCETREPVVALASERELSPSLAAAVSVPANGAGRAHLFAVSAHRQALAVLIATGEVVPAALELLAEVTGASLEALQQPEAVSTPLKPLPSPELIQIVPSSVPEPKGVAAIGTAAGAAQTVTAATGTKSAAQLSWADLSAADQKLHLQAQRVARVKVAEMRLYHADQLRKGVFEANIYQALGNEIDRARTVFLKDFLSQSPTMVDYLHLELLRSLAHDDDRLLGPDYPGPMV